MQTRDPKKKKSSCECNKVVTDIFAKIEFSVDLENYR